MNAHSNHDLHTNTVGTLHSGPNVIDVQLPKASVIIVNTNELHHLKRCLPSLAAQNYHDCEVLVVDNASTDGSVEYIEQEFPWVRIVRNPANLGYTGANNEGFRNATGEYIAVLNPDTKVEPNWLRELVTALHNNPKAGLAAAKVLMMDDPRRINSCGLDITFTGLSFCRGLDESSDKYRQPEIIFGVAGSAFVIKRSVLDEIGGFDDSFFIYYEDTDLSLRAALAGYTCIYVPTAVVYHLYIFKFSARKCFMQERNRYVSLVKTFHWGTLFLLLPMLLLSELIAFSYAAMKGHEHVFSKFRTYIWLARHWREVIQARRQVQKLRRVSDRQILARFSHRLVLAQTTRPWIAALIEKVVNPVLLPLGNISRSLVNW